MVIDNFKEREASYDITFQRIKINEDTLLVESKIILSTLKFEAYKMLDYMDAFSYNESLWYIFEDLQDIDDQQLLKYIQTNKNEWEAIKRKYKLELLEAIKEEKENSQNQ
ncbi:Uncharacterised protein [Mycoplasmopsis columboralis]|nr:hypothetical protein [Mycoplasmopsis columboralis]VEU75951.1 Uncharacterised protein [Mycoplasmopsis columboralis]